MDGIVLHRLQLPVALTLHESSVLPDFPSTIRRVGITSGLLRSGLGHQLPDKEQGK